MAQHAFQEQLVSIMEILAKAAVAEINRRVEDSCAVIRLELSRSQRDIDSLKRKSLLMENELRKARLRGRRKVFFCRTAEKQLPVAFPTVWVRDTPADVCRADQTVVTQEVDPGPSAQHVHQDVQVLEEIPKVSIIKEEGTENEMWTNTEAAVQFPFEHQDGLPHSLAQETHEDQNQLHEATENPNAHLSCTLSGSEQVKSDEEGLSKLGLQIKAEKDHEEEEKDVQEIITEESEQRMGGTGDHLDFVLEQRDPRLWTSINEQGHHAAFSAPVDTAMERSGDDIIDDDVNRPDDGDTAKMDLYGAGQVGQVRAQKRLQTSWCRERRQSSPAVKQIHAQQLRTQQHQHQHPHHRTQQRPAEVVIGTGMTSSTASSVAAQPLVGYRRLRTHWRTSVAGERRFSCTYCERRFVRFGQLKEHLRSHTGERPYTCTQCGRSFTKQGNLIRHAVVHSGEKPYQCGLCGKCFTQRSSLKSHQKTHMPDRDVLPGLPVYQSGSSRAISQSRGFV
uniref:Si:ch211-155e24.3 n=1 Tax=Astyanax mexicanus TaxID=7994 RepID=A0A3B1J161_ASTMX